MLVFCFIPVLFLFVFCSSNIWIFYLKYIWHKRFYFVFGVLVTWSNWLRPKKIIWKIIFWCVISHSKHANISLNQDSLVQKHTYLLTKWKCFLWFSTIVNYWTFCYKYVSNKDKIKILVSCTLNITWPICGCAWYGYYV